MKKYRTSRAVHGNIGIKNAYAKQLLKLEKDFQNYVLAEIFSELESRKMLTDGIDQYTKKLILSKKVRSITAQNFSFVIDDIIGKNYALWLEVLKTESTKIVKKIVKKIVLNSTQSQKRALLSAGIKRSIFEKIFTVPIVRGQYIAPSTAQKIDELVKNNVEMISNIAERDISRISEVITTGTQNGLDYEAIRNELRNTDGFTSARANRVALDQVNKINQSVQIENAKDLGCTRAQWVHVAGQYTSRRCHEKFNGKIFELAKGLYDEDVKEYVFPAQLPYCRCFQKMIIPEELLKE